MALASPAEPRSYLLNSSAAATAECSVPRANHGSTHGTYSVCRFSSMCSVTGCATGGFLSDASKRRDPCGDLFVVMPANLLLAPLLIVAPHATNEGSVTFNPLLAIMVNLWRGSAADIGPGVCATADVASRAR
jgi:hypothetical protein